MPRITDINIKNLRGLEDITLKDARMFNVIVGPSEIGKTTVLEGLFISSSMAYMPGLINVNTIRGANLNNHDDARSVLHSLYKDLKADSIDINLKIKDDVQNIQYRYNTLFTKQYIANETITLDNNKKFSGYQNQNKLTGIQAKVEFSGSITGGIEKTLFLSGQEDSGGMQENRGEIDIKRDGIALDLNKVSTLVPNSHMHQAHDLRRAIETSTEQKKKKIMLYALKKINPQIENVEMAGEKLFIDIGLEVNMGIHITGSGVREAISTIGVLCTPGISIFLFDEIGKGIYYGSLKGYLQALLHFAKEQNKQIFATTHSKDILIALKQVAEEDESMREEIMCYSLARDKYKKVRAYSYGFEEFQSCIDDDMEIR